MSGMVPPEIRSRRTELERICASLGVRRLELFGSATHAGAAPREYADAYFQLLVFRQRVEQEKALLYASNSGSGS